MLFNLRSDEQALNLHACMPFFFVFFIRYKYDYRWVDGAMLYHCLCTHHMHSPACVSSVALSGFWEFASSREFASNI